MLRPFLCWVLLAGFFFAVGGVAQCNEDNSYQIEADARCKEALRQWRHARGPEEKKRLAGELFDAAVRAQKPEVAEQAVAGGRMADKKLHVPHRARKVALQEVRSFDDIKASLDHENGDFNYQHSNGWLIRRITAKAFEVWTPVHGWLFDDQGRLLNEARPPRRDGHGREWYGAFLPDGSWVTTDLDDFDATLSFFSREGTFLRAMTSTELAPPSPQGNKHALLGWGRSDKEGTAWIVNVGSEGGRATVRVGPEGPACILTGIERWQLCYPRALGARGWSIDMDVPDDSGTWLLHQSAAGHGPSVGFPNYHVRAASDFSLNDELNADVDRLPLKFCESIPGGGFVFGFWPGSTNLFIGSQTYEEKRADAAHGQVESESYYMDKTWFFTLAGRFKGWLAARRIADGADKRTLLFRMNDDSRVAALDPNRYVASVRRFVWPNGETADAVSLFDDLHLGLFIRGEHPVLARW